MKRLLLVTAALLALGGQAGPQTSPAGDKPWATKDWRTWSKKDCEKVLGDSPWVASSPFGFRRTPLAQLRSAAPIRQAFLRLKQIEKRYDRMSAQQREAFDRQIEAEYGEQFGENIVVRVTAKWSKDFIVRDRGKNTGTTAILLLPKGRHVVASEFHSDGQNVLAIFPRVLDGEPVIRPEDAIVTFLIGAPEKTSFTAEDAPYIFKLDDMTYRGKREF